MVKSYQGATSGTKGTLNAVQVFSLSSLQLDVPGSFVKRLLEGATTTYDAIQGFGLNPNADEALQAIYYRNFEHVTLNFGDFAENIASPCRLQRRRCKGSVDLYSCIIPRSS